MGNSQYATSASNPGQGRRRREPSVADVAVIGVGYVGLLTGACLAELGHHVTGVEIEPRRLSSLREDRLPLHEPGLDELVATNRAARRLRFTKDYEEAIPRSQFAFVAVNTPPGPSGEADTTFVFSAVRSIMQHAPPGLIVVIKSTVPVGTGDEVKRLVSDAGQEVEVVSNPEFLRQGTAIENFMHPDRIVVGASHPRSADAVAALYRDLSAPVLICSRRSAELAKYAANALLASRISFMNEVSAIAEAVQADIDDVARIIGADRRIGPSFLRAGLGWGGPCFPKDVLALIHTAVSRGLRPWILQSVFDVNLQQRERALEKILSSLNGAESPIVGVLGLASKSDTDDVRESPALDIIGRLLQQEISVRAHDPLATANAQLVIPGVVYCEDAYEVAQSCDLLLLATEWYDYITLDWERVRSLMRGRILLDGRNVLDGEALSRLGFTYLSFGRYVDGAEEAPPPLSGLEAADDPGMREAVS